METYKSLTLTVILCAAGLQLVHAGVVHGKQCKQVDPSFSTIKAVRVENCTADQESCVMQKKGKYKVEFDFIATKSSDHLNVTAYGSLFGVEVKWIGMKTDACKYGGVPCPIVEGKQYTYSYPVEIQSMYPSISLDTVWYLHVEPAQTQMACFKVPVKLISAPSK